LSGGAPMTLADVLAAAAGLALLGAGSGALVLLYATFLPRAVGRARVKLEESPVLTFLTGLTLFGVLFFALVVFVNAPGGANLLGCLATRGPLARAAVGAPALSSHVGARLAREPLAKPSSKTLLSGALLVGLSSLVPILGWFLVLPAALFLSLGAGLRGLVGR